MNKQTLRRQFLTVRNQLDRASRAQWSQEICTVLHTFQPLQQAETVAAYYPLGSEVDLRPLLNLWEQEGKRIALPISYQNGKMVFHEAKLEELEQGMYGIFQPPPRSAVIMPKEIDCIITPGVAFDSAGGRIGYGKGYYDRILQQYAGLTVGACFAAQITDSVSAEPHDVPLQYLAHERGIYQVGKDRTNERQIDSNDR